MSIASKGMMILGMAIAMIVPAQGAQADEELAQKSGCLACHSVDNKIVGPAYKDIAAKYKDDAGAVDRLTQKVLEGGGGVWGEAPMPPNVLVSKENARKLVEWILSLDK